MKSRIGAFEAKTNWSALLDRVAQGESITITKRGVPVAVLSRPEGEGQMGPKEAVEAMRKIQEEMRNFPT